MSEFIIINIVMINPKCHKNQGIALSAEGYFFPCCWCDNEQSKNINEFKLWGFYSDETHIDNIETLDDIFNSNAWIEFNDMLINNPEYAPEICKNKCNE